MSRRSLRAPRALPSTALHLLEWGAALALVSAGSPWHLDWRMAACGALAAASVGRVRRATALPAPPPALAAPKSAPRSSPVPASPTTAPPPPASHRESPRRESSGQKAAARAPSRRASARTLIAAPSAQVGTVLLAEDDPVNQTMVTRQLRRLGYAVTAAGNGRVAVDLALAAAGAGQPFDVILMDMQMPKLDGYGATRELRDRGYSGSIVALTAHVVPEDRERFFAAGGDDYLTKPIDRAKLLSCVRGRVGMAREAMENADTRMGRLTSVPASDDAPLVSELAGDADIADILVGFVRLLGARGVSLAEAFAGRDMDALKRVVHQLKGAAGGYGFPSITEQAKVVEEAMANAGDGSQLRLAVDALCSLCRRAARGAAPVERAAV